MNMKNFPKRLDSKTSCLRISVPENLDLALEGLIRKVLREQPKTDDIYSFAADYFETLLKIRDKLGAKFTSDQLCPFHNDEDAHEMIKLATSFTKPPPKTSEPLPLASKKKQPEPKKPKKQPKPKKPDLVRKLPTTIDTLPEEFLASGPVKKLVEKEIMESKSRSVESVPESVIQSEKAKTTENDAEKLMKRPADDVSPLEGNENEEAERDENSNVEGEDNKDFVRKNVEEINKESNGKVDPENVSTGNETVLQEVRKKSAEEMNETLKGETNHKSVKKPSLVAADSDINTKENKDSSQKGADESNKEINITKEIDTDTTNSERFENVTAEIKNITKKDSTRKEEETTNDEMNDLKTTEENIQNIKKLEIIAAESDIAVKNSVKEIKTEASERLNDDANLKKLENVAVKHETTEKENETSLHISEEKENKENDKHDKIKTKANDVEKPENVAAEKEQNTFKSSKSENLALGCETFKKKNFSLPGVAEKREEEINGANEIKTDTAIDEKSEDVEAENNTYMKENKSTLPNDQETPNLEETLRDFAYMENTLNVAADSERKAKENKDLLQKDAEETDKENSKKKISEPAEIKTDTAIDEKTEAVEAENYTYMKENKFTLLSDEEKTNLQEILTDVALVENTLNVAEDSKTVEHKNKTFVQKANLENNNEINGELEKDTDISNTENRNGVAADNTASEKKNKDNFSEDEEIKPENKRASDTDAKRAENLENRTREQKTATAEINGKINGTPKLEKEVMNVAAEDPDFLPRNNEDSSVNLRAAAEENEENKNDKTNVEEATNVEENTSTPGKIELIQITATATNNGEETTESKNEEFLMATLEEPNQISNKPEFEEQPKNATEQTAFPKEKKEKNQTCTGDDKANELNNNLPIQAQILTESTSSSAPKEEPELSKDYPTEEQCTLVHVQDIPESQANEEEFCAVVDVQHIPKDVRTPEEPTQRVESPLITVEEVKEVEEASYHQDKIQIKTIQTRYYNTLQVPEMVTKEYRLHSVVPEAINTLQESTSRDPSDDLMTPTSVSSLNLSDLSWQTITGIFLDSEKRYSSLEPTENQPVVEEVFHKTVISSNVKAVPDPPRDPQELNEGNRQEKMKDKPRNSSSDESDNERSTESDVPFISVEVKTVIETEILGDEDEKAGGEKQPDVEVKIETTIDILDQPESAKEEMSDVESQEKTERTPNLEKTQDKSQQDQIKASSSTEQTTAKEGSSGESDSTISSAPTEIKKTDFEKRNLSSTRSLLSTQSLDYGKRSPLIKTRSLSAFRHGVTDFEVWNAIEKELEEAATKIQSKFRGYKTRKKLQRENAVQITTEESPISTTPVEAEAKDERQENTGEFHDSIVLFEHPR